MAVNGMFIDHTKVVIPDVERLFELDLYLKDPHHSKELHRRWEFF